MKNNKGFASIIIIGIIVLVVAIGGSFGLYYFNNLNNKNTETISPTPTILNTSLATSSSVTSPVPSATTLTPIQPISSSNSASSTITWTKYKSDNYGFEFEYPANWKKSPFSTKPDQLLAIGIYIHDIYTYIDAESILKKSTTTNSLMFDFEVLSNKDSLDLNGLRSGVLKAKGFSDARIISIGGKQIILATPTKSSSTPPLVEQGFMFLSSNNKYILTMGFSKMPSTEITTHIISSIIFFEPTKIP